MTEEQIKQAIEDCKKKGSRLSEEINELTSALERCENTNRQKENLEILGKLKNILKEFDDQLKYE